jgi:glycosyltransferase involved in cell wall biosynthesis
MNTPQISVLMSVYNGELFLRESIESILGQTFGDYEFIIINDGSTDGTKEILDKFSATDTRIKVINQKNRGQASSFNKHYKYARAGYIAIMDSDDISLPTRFEKQIKFLENHPEIGILGTWIELINEEGHVTGKWCTPVLPGLVKWGLTYSASIAHATVLMRRTIFSQLKGYNERTPYAADYDLWIRAVNLTKAANLPEVLYKYRIWGKSVCATFKNEQFDNTTGVINSYLDKLLTPQIDYDLVISFRKFFLNQTLHDHRESILVGRLLLRLFRTFVDDPSISQEEIGEIRRDVNEKLFHLIVSTFRISPWASLTILLQSLAVSPLVFTKVSLTKVRTRFFGK